MGKVTWCKLVTLLSVRHGSAATRHALLLNTTRLFWHVVDHHPLAHFLGGLH